MSLRELALPKGFVRCLRDAFAVNDVQYIESMVLLFADQNSPHRIKWIVLPKQFGSEFAIEMNDSSWQRVCSWSSRARGTPVLLGWCHSHHRLAITPSVPDIETHWMMQSNHGANTYMLIINQQELKCWHLHADAMRSLAPLSGNMPDGTDPFSLLVGLLLKLAQPFKATFVDLFPSKPLRLRKVSGGLLRSRLPHMFRSTAPKASSTIGGAGAGDNLQPPDAHASAMPSSQLTTYSAAQTSAPEGETQLTPWCATQASAPPGETSRGRGFANAVVAADLYGARLPDPVAAIMEPIAACSRSDDLDGFLFPDRASVGLKDKQQVYDTMQRWVADTLKSEARVEEVYASMDYDLRLTTAMPLAEAINKFEPARAAQPKCSTINHKLCRMF